jgi:microcin C transport system substrate-binding protein
MAPCDLFCFIAFAGAFHGAGAQDAPKPRHRLHGTGGARAAAGFPRLSLRQRERAERGSRSTSFDIGTFDSFNPFILRGTAEAHGVGPWVVLPGGSGSGSSVGHRMGKPADRHRPMRSTPGTAICAKRSKCLTDKTWVAFNLAAGSEILRRHAGHRRRRRLDVRTLMEQGRSVMRVQFADPKDVVVEGPLRVRFNFKTTQNRELPLLAGGLPVLPKHFSMGATSRNH